MTTCPYDTPWGRTQHRKKLAEGIWNLSTASHGGIFVSYAAAATMNQKAFRRAIHWEATGYFFEEDCDYCFPLLENKEARANMAKHCNISTQAMLRACLVSAARMDPSYAADKGFPVCAHAYAERLTWDYADKLRKEKSPDLIIAARGDWHTKIPGVVEVVTADEKKHLVTAKSYDGRDNRPLNLLSDCVLLQSLVESAA